MFYPRDPVALAQLVDSLVSAGTASDTAPKALIVPHAGYQYSGPTAGRGYSLLAPARETIERVVLVGPAHRAPIYGLATSSADALATPLGAITIDTAGREIVLAHPSVSVDDRAHSQEHSLEVHLPFVQRVLPDTQVLPLLAGRADAATVADVLELVWGGPETVVIISTDLSHYHPYDVAVRIDQATADVIVHRDHERLAGQDACGAVAVRGVLEVARRKGLTVSLIDLCTSGDTAGDRDRVVGYGAFAVA
jgi:MEMO1 family protein